MTDASAQSISRPIKNTLVERCFFPGMALTMMAICLRAFTPSIAHPVERRAPLSALATAHGIVLFVWIMLFLVQSTFISTQHITQHRRLGFASVLLLTIMIVLAYTTTIAMVRRGYDLSADLKIDEDPSYAAVFPSANLLLFAVMAIAALVYRRRPEIHKRLMLFANIELMPAPLARLIGHSPRLASLPPAIVMIPLSIFVIAAVMRDFLLERRVHPLTWGLVGLRMVSDPLEAGPIGTSIVWHHVVDCLAR